MSAASSVWFYLVGVALCAVVIVVSTVVAGWQDVADMERQVQHGSLHGEPWEADR